MALAINITDKRALITKCVIIVTVEEEQGNAVFVTHFGVKAL